MGPLLTSFILESGFTAMYRRALLRVLAQLARDEPPEGAEREPHRGVGAALERALAWAAARFDRRRS